MHAGWVGPRQGCLHLGGAPGWRWNNPGMQSSKRPLDQFVSTLTNDSVFANPYDFYSDQFWMFISGLLELIYSSLAYWIGIDIEWTWSLSKCTFVWIVNKLWLLADPTLGVVACCARSCMLDCMFLRLWNYHMIYIAMFEDVLWVPNFASKAQFDGHEIHGFFF